MASDLDEDVALFKKLRERLLDRIEEQAEDLRASLKKAQDTKRDVLGQGAKGTASAPGQGTHGERVLAWLRANPGRRSIAEISAGAGLDRMQANQVLIVLHGARLIRRPARGLYEANGPPLLMPHKAEVEPSADPPADAPPRRETPADRMKRMRAAQSETQEKGRRS